MSTTLPSSLKNLTQDGQKKIAFGPTIDGFMLECNSKPFTLVCPFGINLFFYENE
jgi:hypothetical protein